MIYDWDNERPDMQLARDRALTDSGEHQQRIAVQNRELALRCGEWGDGSLLDLVRGLVAKRSGGGFFHKEHYAYEDGQKIRYEILIEQGWSCDDFDLDLITDRSGCGDTFELCLRYSEELE